MGIQFRKRIKLGKGIGVTISKSGITPSYRSKKGSISSKGYSINTGIPGLSYRKTFKKTKNNGCLASLLLCILIPLLAIPISCKTDKTNDVSSVKTNKDTLKWYNGGTLHKGTIKTWKGATEKNKLATCADFCTNYYKTFNIVDTKVAANNLKICINEAVKGHDTSNALSVSEVAAMCLILLEN